MAVLLEGDEARGAEGGRRFTLPCAGIIRIRFQGSASHPAASCAAARTPSVGASVRHCREGASAGRMAATMLCRRACLPSLPRGRAGGRALLPAVRRAARAERRRAAPRSRRAAPGGGPVRRSRRLHVAVERARSRRRCIAAHPLLRARGRAGRATRRNRRQAHRRRGDGGVRRAGRARQRHVACAARRPGRARGDGRRSPHSSGARWPRMSAWRAARSSPRTRAATCIAATR